MKYHILKTGLVIYIISVILLITLPLNSSSEANNTFVFRLRGDYIFHILMFLPWAFFQPSVKATRLPWLLYGLLFAFGTETLHYLLPWRSFNINDLIANAAGVILGFIIFHIFARKFLSN